MLGTREKAAKKFTEYVKWANGNAYLVYQALSSTEHPTDEYIKRYISQEVDKELAQIYLAESIGMLQAIAEKEKDKSIKKYIKKEIKKFKQALK